jgi:DNA-binding response OmpR family regulator
VSVPLLLSERGLLVRIGLPRVALVGSVDAGPGVERRRRRQKQVVLDERQRAAALADEPLPPLVGPIARRAHRDQVVGGVGLEVAVEGVAERLGPEVGDVVAAVAEVVPEVPHRAEHQRELLRVVAASVRELVGFHEQHVVRRLERRHGRVQLIAEKPDRHRLGSRAGRTKSHRPTGTTALIDASGTVAAAGGAIRRPLFGGKNLDGGRSGGRWTAMDGATSRVLVVEDEPDLAELYAIYLSDLYDVQTATNGETALEIVDEETDVVLLDRRMPDLTGDEVLEEIRARGLETQVAMITAVEPDVDIVEMQFDDYLVKPVTKEDLHGLVEILLRRANYDERSQEFFRLASKKAALESSPDVSVENEGEYRELAQRMEDIRAELDDTLAELSDDDFREAFASFPDIEVDESGPDGDDGPASQS